VARDDGVAGDQDRVLPVDQRRIDGQREHAHGDFAAVAGRGVEGLELAGGRLAADHGAERQVLPGGHGRLLARIQVRRLVLQQVAEVGGLGERGITDCP